MNINLEFFILCFSSIFALVNPIGLVPIFLSITQDYNKKERDIIALKATIFSFFILIIFSMIGDLIFSFYNITIHGFRIAGGILLLKISFDMIESKRSRTKTTPKEEKEAEDKNEIAYTPLGIPLIAGPGSIASMMILSSESTNNSKKLSLKGFMQMSPERINEKLGYIDGNICLIGILFQSSSMNQVLKVKQKKE